eukprot:106920_1
MSLLHKLHRRAFCSESNLRHVIGCGSNVVDIFHKVESLPLGGQKGYFQNPTEPISAKLVGGVTLNHLSWARLLGTPTSLLALEGDDENGILIRNKLQELNIGTNTIDVSNNYCTSVSHIFLDSNGERCIMMAPGSTSTINKDIVNNIFYKHFENKNVCLFSTEISQVPLIGVIEMLNLSKKFNIPSIIDVDVPPSVAVTDANLGNMDQVYESIEKSTMIKPTLEAAIELLGINMTEEEIDNIDVNGLHDIAKELKARFKDSKFIAITNGKKGAVILNNHEIVDIKPLSGIKQIDSTGAGDAFFGGIIAGVYHYGIPQNVTELQRIGDIAKCTGAACVEVLGALPMLDGENNSSGRLLDLNGGLLDMMEINPIPKISEMEQKGLKLSPAMSSILTDCESLTELFNLDGFDIQIEGLVTEIERCKKIFVTGVGKSAIMAERMAASLSSIGYSAEYVNGNDWIHGDFGKLKLKNKNVKNLVISFSASGKTREVYDAMRWVCDERIPEDICVDYDAFKYKYNTHIFGVFCINEQDVKQCRNSDFWMGDVVDNIVYLGKQNNELMECIPSRSVVVQEAFVNAVMTVLYEKKPQQTMDAFKVNHPGGNIGKILKEN